MKSYLFFLAALQTVCAVSSTLAADRFLKPGDVVAFVGGEDMVVAAEYGYLEYLLVRAHPDYDLKFRSLAWEGDTVFAQPRDFNYPTLEQQLDGFGITVVIAQFGQMECLAGERELPAFIAAYEQLIERLGGAGRRVALLGPTPISVQSPAFSRFSAIDLYGEAIRELAKRRGLLCMIPDHRIGLPAASLRDDGMHLNEAGHFAIATQLAEVLGATQRPDEFMSRDKIRLAEFIQGKNRLWFHYVRPQNWAFLDGDRSDRPASRDHLDFERRWFPEEMKEWLSLIENREQEIWKLARQIAGE